MKASDDLKREINPKAQTIKEICAESGLADSTVSRVAKRYTDAGKWKRVFKKDGARLVYAYLKVK